MAKIELKGIVKKVTGIETVGAKGSRKQSVILHVPAFRDSFGELRGEDEEWRLDLFNARIDKLNLNNNLVDKKVICQVYISSARVEGKDGQEFHIVNSNLGEIKVFEGYTPGPQPSKNNW